MQHPQRPATASGLDLSQNNVFSFLGFLVSSGMQKAGCPSLRAEPPPRGYFEPEAVFGGPGNSDRASLGPRVGMSAVQETNRNAAAPRKPNARSANPQKQKKAPAEAGAYTGRSN